MTELEDGTTLYSFYDFERSTPLIVLVVLFVGAVVALGRWRGVGALAGLVVSLAIIVWFALPSLVDGNNAVSVALVTAGAVAIVALVPGARRRAGDGRGTAVDVRQPRPDRCCWRGSSSRSGTSPGLTDDASFVLQSLETGIDPRGILLAGIVIGSLGVLDDVTVTQVSAVWELHRSRPDAGRRTLFTSALTIGRDHISSTVNTLFLAYAGAALPLLLLFTGVGESITGVATARSWRRRSCGPSSARSVSSRPCRSARGWPRQVVTSRPSREAVRPTRRRPRAG